MRCYQAIAFSLLLILHFSSFGQNPPIKYSLINTDDVTVDLVVTLAKNPCGPNSKKSTFEIDLTNMDGITEFGQFLSWEMDVVNCDMNTVRYVFNIDLYALSEGRNKSMEWWFEGNQIEKEPYNIENDFSYEETIVLAPAQSEKPDRIEGLDEVMTGTDVLLTLYGGNLTKDAKWVWYEGSCGGTAVGEGESIQVKPSQTTTYYVRGEGNLMSDCASFTVKVDNESRPAESILGTDKICKSEMIKPIVLERLGGKLGYQAKWIWYEGNCGTKKIGEGDKVVVTPNITTTYSLRAEGETISPSSCIFKTIEVVEPSIKPTGIANGNRSEKICVGEPVTLRPQGGKLAPAAQWEWRAQTDGSNKPEYKGVGAFLQDYPKLNTTYYVKASDGFCPDTEEASIYVEVKQKTIPPSGITISNIKKKKFKASLIGGQLGENSQWIWFMNNCSGSAFKKTQENEIQFKARKKDKLLLVRYEGECNASEQTDCIQRDISFTKKVSKKKFAVLNGGLVSNGNDQLTNYVGTLGSHKFVLRYKWGQPGGQYQYSQGQITNISTGSTISYTGNKFSFRRGYTMDFMFGGGFKFYMGVGYGQYQEMLEANITSNGSTSKQLVKNMDVITEGPEGEAGFFIKMGPFNLMFGASAIYDLQRQNQYLDGHVGLGFCL